MASAYRKCRNINLRNRTSKLMIAAVVLLLALLLCRQFLDNANRQELGTTNTQVDVLKARDAEARTTKASKTIDPNNETVLNPPKPPAISHLTETQKLKQNCVNFHKKIRKRTSTRFCRQDLDKRTLKKYIMNDAYEWKRKHLEIFQKMIGDRANKHILVAIDIGSGTGAITLVNSLYHTKSIALDPYFENLLVLRRALKLLNNVFYVKQLLYTATNTSTFDFETFNVGPERKITLDDINKHYMVPGEVVHVWVSHEGYELEVLQGGGTVFGGLQVCFVVVDFSRPRTRQTGVEIVEFMRQFNLHPFEDLKRTMSLANVPPYQFESGVVFMSEDKIPCKVP